MLNDPVLLFDLAYLAVLFGGGWIWYRVSLLIGKRRARR